MREGFVQVGSRKIWYAVYGEEKKGTPLLVLHGGPGLQNNEARFQIEAGLRYGVMIAR